MSIIVSAVPASTRRPGAYFDINTKAAKLGLPASTDKVLIIATQLAIATATAGTAVQVVSAAEAREMFGSGSPCALMVEALLEQSPYLNEVWVCPLGEAGGSAAATATIQFADDGLEAGTLTLYIGRHAVTVGLTAADDADSIAIAAAAAIEADDSLPFSAAVDGEDTDTINLTCKSKGTQGNKWVLAADYTAAGLTATIVQPASGATDADIATALTAVANTQFDLIVPEWNDATSLGALVSHLDTVGAALEQRPGIGVAGFVGSVSSATSLATARNSGVLTVGAMRGTRTHPYEIAAAYAAMIAAEEDRARPLNDLVLVVGEVPDVLANRYSNSEVATLLANGVAPFHADDDGTVRLIRSITTYVENDFGDADDTLLDLQTMRVLFYVRYAVRYRCRTELGRVKLADQARTPNTTDPAKVRSLILGTLFQLQDELGYLENVETFKDRLVVERDGTVATRINATIPSDIVNGLHVVAGSIDLIL